MYCITLRNFLFDAIEALRVQLSVAFGIAIPALLISYLLIKPLERKIQEENAR